MMRHTDGAQGIVSGKNAAKRKSTRCIRPWAGCIAALFAMAGSVMAQTPDAQPTGEGQVVVAEERLVLSAGSSKTLTAANPLTRAAVATPEVAEVSIVSPVQVLVTGRSIGSTQLILWDRAGNQTVYDVLVEPDLSQLKAAIEQVAPGSEIQVRVLRDALILTGRATDVDAADRVMKLASVITPNVINQITIAGEQQVLLRCTVAEVSKQGLRQLGINGWLAGDNIRDVFAVNQIGGINPVNIGAAGGQNVIRPNGLLFGTDSDGLNMLTPPGGPTFSLGFPRVQMQLFFKALRENSLLKVLAEPNLVALNGKEAVFVAGGEFPIPVPQGVSGAVTIEFKEFGIRLRFIPTVIGRQMIRLRVVPEVSELDFTASVQFSGFVVPGLTKRSAETTLELASGTTIAMAGLLSDSVRAVADKLPALGDVPVLGALFSSVDYRRNTTELVILVTPELVSGMNPDQVPPVPGQHMSEPNDWELFGLGMTEGQPVCDPSTPEDALDTHPAPRYRKFSSSPHQMSLHGPWGQADEVEIID